MQKYAILFRKFHVFTFSWQLLPSFNIGAGPHVNFIYPIIYQTIR